MRNIVWIPSGPAHISLLAYSVTFDQVLFLWWAACGSGITMFSKVHNPNIPVFRQADMSLDYKAWSAWIVCVLCSDRVLHDYLSMKDPPCVTLQMLMRHLPSAAFNSYCLIGMGGSILKYRYFRYWCCIERIDPNIKISILKCIFLTTNFIY